ncbi:MAG TPA: hypothetical protein VK835_06120 [Bacteroidia bacterium]|nr:hypothetical protein [Bacteroidia bacterium]
MKKKVVKLLFAALFFGASLSASAQIYVKIRPIVPVVVMTERPGPDHVWVNEDWNEDNGNYVYAGGYWNAPPRRGDRWNEGHWNHHPEHGDHWERGNWSHKRK